MTTKEITVYEQTNENSVLYLYCEDCKPKGGKKGTFVVSTPDQFCADCGKDFLEMAQDTTPEPELTDDDEELSPEDIAALEEAMTQPTLGPYTFEELTHLLTGTRFQVGGAVTVDLYGVKSGKVAATHDPGDGYGMSVEIELDEMWRGGKKFWFEAKDVTPVLTLQHAWDALQSVTAYTERFHCYHRYHNGLAAFAEAISIIAYMQKDAFELDGPLEVAVWEETGKRLEAWLEEQGEVEAVA